jgi:hypothetical protein
MRAFITVTLTVLALATSAGAQQRSGPDPLELGVDAGLFIGFGDNSSTRLQIPVSSARIGFPIGVRTSLEPRFMLNVYNNGADYTQYLLELGLLYHLGSDRYPGAYHRAGMYVRPFLGIEGYANGDSDSDGILGIGLGFKHPLVSRLSSRFEANVAHRFDDATEIGLLAGLSFFTR